jgi:hypothetical protein
LAGGHGDWFEKSPCPAPAVSVPVMRSRFLAVVLVLDVADRVLERVGDVVIADAMCARGGVDSLL